MRKRLPNVWRLWRYERREFLVKAGYRWPHADAISRLEAQARYELEAKVGATQDAIETVLLGTPTGRPVIGVTVNLDALDPAARQAALKMGKRQAERQSRKLAEAVLVQNVD